MITQMSAPSSPSYDEHELVSFTHDSTTGLRAFIAVHDTTLGAAVGGCRMFPYVNDAQALEDVLRLSRGMTYKSALAGLPMGGGKAVIIGDHQIDKTPALLEAMGRFIDSHNGKYITAEDSGTCVADMKVIACQTDFVSGVSDDQPFGGDPSPLTAYGIFCGIQAAVQHRLNASDLRGVQVAVQGAGAVGYYLIKQLIAAGTTVLVADINVNNVKRAQALGAKAVSVKDIVSVQADVFAPCAMGAILNDTTIPTLGAPIVAGGANNQLSEIRHAEMLRQRGVLYAPDFVINAGGIIEIYHQGILSKGSRAHIRRISDTLSKIFTVSDEQQLSTALVAEKLARAKFKPVPQSTNKQTVSDAA